MQKIKFSEFHKLFHSFFYFVGFFGFETSETVGLLVAMKEIVSVCGNIFV